MGYNRNKVRRVVKEDRLSSLPDELLHKILFCVDMKVVVGTCLLSSRWKLLWTSMPYLNFSSEKIRSMLKFDKFVTGVLSHRNHQIQVSSVKLNFSNISHTIVQKIAAYMFSHDVQELTIVSCSPNIPEFIPRLFSFQSLKNFTLNNRYFSIPPFVTPKTPWDFPNLTTLHLSHLTLCDDHDTTYQESVDLFSKCVNLKNLTLKHFVVKGVEVFNIITPRLSSLMLIDGRCSKTMNLVAPQLENITLIRCTFIKYLNAPPGLSSLYYKGNCPIQLSKNGFHSLNEVTVCLSGQCSKEIARKTINMLQELHSVRYLTLKVDIVECISWFPDLLIHHSSPFRNLICLTIDCSTRKNYAYKVKMSTEARNFLLENSPSATLVIKLPEEPPAKAMKQKRAKKLQELSKDKIMQTEPERASIGQAKESYKKEMQTQVDQGKAHTESEQLLTRLMAQFKSCLVDEGESDVIDVWSKRDQNISLSTRERADIEARDFQELEETEAQCARLVSRIVTSEEFYALEKLLFDDDN